MRLHSSSLFLLLCFVAPLVVGARAEVAPVAIAGLGALTFPTSTHSPEAQSEFLRGVLLLHAFEYASAAQTFQAAEALDPSFAMAYWGEAMTANHPVWNQLNQAAGQKALARFAKTPAERAARIADPRERSYLAAVEVLYDPAGTKAERDVRYAEAMRALSESYPGDDEALLFYSLALLGRSEGKRDVPTYLQAAAIAQQAFRRNPMHPGAAHYWIHGMDDPQHAAAALPAADALAKIAPHAGHALHMCSHIYMALGMWNEVVKANEEAMRVVAEQDHAGGRPAIGCFHYAHWLEYGYFQQGRRRKAEEMVAACKLSAEGAVHGMEEGHAGPMSQSGMTTTPETLKRAAASSLVEMRDIAVIESADWNGAAARMQVDEKGLGDSAAWYAFTDGLAAAMRGDAALSSAAMKRLRGVIAEGATESRTPQQAAYLAVLEEELAGTMAARAGHMDEAVAQLKQASATYEAQPFDFGPPVVVKPPEELLGEVLLARSDGEGAVEAFRASLRLAPNRARSLAGLARAEALAGDPAASRATWAQLMKAWVSADSDLSELREARAGLVAAGPGAARQRQDARLESVDRACGESGTDAELNHGIHRLDEAVSVMGRRDQCW